MHKVLIPTKLASIAKEILEQNNYTVIQDTESSLSELVSLHNDATALIVRSEKITKEIIDSLPKLKVIARAGAGYNTIDIAHARVKNIAVMNTPGANSNAVAEEVIGMALAINRHFIASDASTRANKWEKSKFMGSELSNKVFGIFGFGNIGQILAKRLQGFDVEILIYDPFISSKKAKEFNVSTATKEEIFSKCDYISLHIPATEETIKMIDKSLISLMKENAVLINCARAEIINEDDLRALKQEKNIYYANDVYYKDEAGEKSIADIADLMLPHLGASTIEANTNAAQKAANQIMGFLEKNITTYVVNKRVPDGLSENYQALAYSIAKLCRSYLGNQDPIHTIELSLYGNLSQYSNYLIAPSIAGLSINFDSFWDYKGATNYLQTQGIKFNLRETDESKGYGDSLTLDLIQGNKDNLKRVSIRGTVTENQLIISRINQFDRLYFSPIGHNLIFIYDDKPGVLAEITQNLANENINIIDIRSPYDQKTKQSIAILKINNVLNQATLETISNNIGSMASCYVCLKN